MQLTQTEKNNSTSQKVIYIDGYQWCGEQEYLECYVHIYIVE